MDSQVAVHLQSGVTHTLLNFTMLFGMPVIRGYSGQAWPRCAAQQSSDIPKKAKTSYLWPKLNRDNTQTLAQQQAAYVSQREPEQEHPMGVGVAGLWLCPNVVVSTQRKCEIHP